MKFNIGSLILSSVVFSTFAFGASKNDFCGTRLRENTVGLSRPNSPKNVMPASLVLTELGLEKLVPAVDGYFFNIKKSSLVLDPAKKTLFSKDGVLFTTSRSVLSDVSFSERGGLATGEQTINSVLVLGDGNGELLPYLLKQRLSRVFAVDKEYIAVNPDAPVLGEGTRFDPHYSKDFGAHLIGLDVRDIGRGAKASEKLQSGFDLIVSHNVLSTVKIEEQAAILRGAYSLLNPGGQMRHAIVIQGDAVSRMRHDAVAQGNQRELERILAAQISTSLKGFEDNLNIAVTLSDVNFAPTKPTREDLAWATNEGISRQEFEATAAHYEALYRSASFGDRVVINIVVSKPVKPESKTWFGRAFDWLF